jgi:hypothetical protein
MFQEEVDKLKRETEFYWKFTQENTSLDSNIVSYICKSIREDSRSLLQAELEYTRAHNKINVQPCNTLVLLVGLSLEPLLQLICVYKPQKIALILNEEGYPAKDENGKFTNIEPHVFASYILRAVGKLNKKGLIEGIPLFLPDNKHIGFPTKEDKIFKTLVEALHDETDVVVDITGAKKKMVAGAFLYAAFSGVRISYVDFDQYCPVNRRPYGYSCKIGELANPYRDFALKEWERIRALYNTYRFNEAIETLNSIKDTMISKLPQSKEPIDNLLAAFDFYNSWNQGDFYYAKNKAGQIRALLGELPSAIEKLSDDWYRFSGSTNSHTPTPLYGDNERLTIYVYDEIKRIERLIKYNEDYRSAFLRAGGLNEVIMLGRLVQLVEDQTEKCRLLNKLKDKTPNAEDVFKAFLNESQNIFTIGEKDGNKRCDIYLPGFNKMNVSIPTMKRWWNDKSTMFKDTEKQGYRKFLDIRNDVAHKNYPIPREWAEEGLKFVKANFEDYLKHPLEDLKYCAEALSWSELCNICEAQTFLTPNLRSDG